MEGKPLENKSIKKRGTVKKLDWLQFVERCKISKSKRGKQQNNFTNAGTAKNNISSAIK